MRTSSIRAPMILTGIALALGACATESTGPDPAEVAESIEPEMAGILVPHESWPTGMPEGIPAPEQGVLVFQAEIAIGADLDVGSTPYGERRVRVGAEGVVSGPRMSGVVMPGSLEFDLTLQNGVVERQQILVFQTDDGSYLYARGAGTGPDANDVRTVLVVEAPNDSAWAWMHTTDLVARRVLDPDAGTMAITVYDVTDVARAGATASVVQIEKPTAVPHQSWDYRMADPAETPGDELIVETVTLAPSQAVGPTRDGIRRNIIPITGGTLDGQVSGKVLFGGADYQNLAAPPTIDAQYLWETDDGEIIIVRNGGSFGGLVPTFETRTDGPYAWLNTGLYLSANPTGAPGGVGITMYESIR